MIDINKMRRLAKEQEWIGRWYDAGCETLMAERNGEHEEVAHPIPIGLVPYLIAVQPASILELLDRLEAAEKERDNANAAAAGVALKAQKLEEDRAIDTQRMAILVAELNGAERERDALRAEVIHIKEVEFPRKAQAVADGWRGKCERLEAKVEAAEKERDALRAAVRHEADCVEACKSEIEALRAKIARMEQQEPAGEVVHNGESAGLYDILEHGALLYALPGAQPAPIVPDLLEALKDMVNLVELMCPFDGPQQRKARAAIARATGEQP